MSDDAPTLAPDLTAILADALPAAALPSTMAVLADNFVLTLANARKLTVDDLGKMGIKPGLARLVYEALCAARGPLQEALLAAFPRPSSLASVVYFGLGESLETIAGGGSYGEVVASLVRWAESHDKTAALVEAARKDNPGNPKLRAFAQRYAAEVAEGSRP